MCLESCKLASFENEFTLEEAACNFHETFDSSEKFKTDESKKLDHLRQVFVTKNPILCNEVKKMFTEMSRGCDVFTAEYHECHSLPPPKRWQDLNDATCPLFLTLRQFLEILDASLPKPYFFARNPDSILKTHIESWSESYSTTLMASNIMLNPVNNNKIEFQVENSKLLEIKTDTRKIMTYDVFANTLWPKMNKHVKLVCHPSLVWNEINTYIIGSVEALHSVTGFLSREQYKSIGKKRAPNLLSCRDKIYDLFERYLIEKKHVEGFYFDEAEITFNLYQRMKNYNGLDWVIHEIFVDETQDFTQAELCLLIRCSQQPNNMFFTGDTAQSIMRGISFRFEDLKSLFLYANSSMDTQTNNKSIQVVLC